MESLIFQIVGTLATGVIMFVVGRISVKTKVQEQLECTGKRVDKLEDAVPLMLECHLVTLVALQRGKLNGEGDQVLKKLNDYFFKK